MNIGLRDKYDQGAGLIQINPLDRQYTLLENTVVIDSRNCIGKTSLSDAQVYARSIGKRPLATGKIVSTTGLGVFPIMITFDSTTNLKDDDVIKITGVNGNTIVNGVHKITGIVGNTGLIYTLANGNYTGGGIWVRNEDSSYPTGMNYQNKIIDNAFVIELEKNLKNLRTFTLHHIVIPRDIIPLTVYLPDFLTATTSDLVNVTYTSSSFVQNYTTFIPQEKEYVNLQILGFFSTPLDLFRSYTSGNFSIPDVYTPPPLQLWNPPIGVWPNQPEPYPYQTVPTYRSNDFLIGSESYHIVLSGYGVYDLADWTSRDPGLTTAQNQLKTENMRRLLLLLICQKQSYKNVDYVELILNCSVTSNTDVSLAFGFGDFQRYVPGPGVAQSYQPGTAKLWYTQPSGPPNVVQPDSPIPFPNFRGNVWGPYTAPGDRFQKFGLRSTLQDLFLNGDTSNLNGLPIVLPEVPTEDIPDHPLFGLNFNTLSELNLGNISQVQNPNILNAMRIISNGFGASNAMATGGGAFYTSNAYVGVNTAGGIGPSSVGAPVSWSNTGIYGAPSLDDPMAQGPLNGGLTPASASATDVSITNSVSFFDFGANNGQFVNGILKYINYVVNEIPDTDLIIKVEESLRDERVLTTDSFNSDCILDCPIRLSLGSTSGTVQYIESLQSLVGNASEYWEKRYFNSKAELSMLHIRLYSYDGTSIPIEKMLQLRTSSEFLDLYSRVLRDMVDDPINGIVLKNTPFENFSFDPLNPALIGRVKRYMQIRFKVQCYEGSPPGLEPNTYMEKRHNQFN